MPATSTGVDATVQPAQRSVRGAAPRGCRSRTSWPPQSSATGRVAEHAQDVSRAAFLHDHRGDPCVVGAGVEQPRRRRGPESRRWRRRCWPRGATERLTDGSSGVLRGASPSTTWVQFGRPSMSRSPAPNPLAAIRMGGRGPNEVAMAARMAAPVGVVELHGHVPAPGGSTCEESGRRPVTGWAGSRGRCARCRCRWRPRTR